MKAQFHRLTRERGWSLRQAAQELGISSATAKAWSDEEPTPERPVSLDQEESKATLALLTKALELLEGITELDTSRNNKERADAVDKLLGKYLALQGRASDGSAAPDPALEAILQRFMEAPDDGPSSDVQPGAEGEVPSVPGSEG